MFFTSLIVTVTGASFVVFNGALKTTTGLTAKSSIVEDGIMVQVTQDKMSEIRKSLEKMEDFEIRCGPVGAEMPDETVRVNWVSQNTALNHGFVETIGFSLSSQSALIICISES